MVLELCQFFEILDRFHGNVKKIGVKRQPKLKIFVLVLVLTPNATFCQPMARSEKISFFGTPYSSPINMLKVKAQISSSPINQATASDLPFYDIFAPNKKLTLSKFLMTSLHVICALGSPQSNILATPMARGQIAQSLGNFEAKKKLAILTPI